MSSYKYKPV